MAKETNEKIEKKEEKSKKGKVIIRILYDKLNNCNNISLLHVLDKNNILAFFIYFSLHNNIYTNNLFSSI